MKKVIFYFDGFNFYNGLRSKSEKDRTWKDYYWIDFVKFCNQFIYDGSELAAIKYFTAPPMNTYKRSKQSALFGANKLLNPLLFQVYNGQYQNRTINCGICKKDFQHPEEKRTDVNISVSMLMDCLHNRVDTLVLVSADSDQVPTIQAIKQNFPTKNVKVYFPPNRTSSDLLAHAKPVVLLENNESRFKNSVMPILVNVGDKKYTMPEDWKP